MKNLKRVLSLGLASVMLLGMMVVGASAKDFTDAEDIVHDEAVNVMVALKIINGKEDGSTFAPKDNVTRAEMAKMIAVLMNGGSEANTGVKGTPSFTDIKGHWAEGWIEYCADMKIINGRGDGTFDPNGLVTGVEALKMVLTAMGYDAVAYELQGAGWAAQTLEHARKTGNVRLTEDLDDVVMTDPASRDVAAQMIWNGLQAYIVDIQPNKNTSSGETTWEYKTQTGVTLLKQRYHANIATGTFDGNYNTGANGTLKGEILVTVDGNIEANKGFGGAHTFPSDLSIDNIGEEVKIVWKDNPKGTKDKADKNDTIYGVFNTGATRVIRDQLSNVKDGDADKDLLNIGGTKYDANKTVEVVVNYSKGVDYPSKGKADSKHAEKDYNLADVLKKNSGDPIKVTFDENGKVERVYLTSTFVAAVTAINSENITLNNSVGTLKIADHDVEEGLKKGDIVLVTPLYSTDYSSSDCVATVKKAATVTGELTAYKDQESVTVGGKVYKLNYKNAEKTRGLLDQNSADPDMKLISDFTGAKDKGGEDKYVGEEVELYLSNKYVVAAVQVSENANNYSVITEVKESNATNSVFNNLQLQVMAADGTKEIITVATSSVDENGDKATTSDKYGVGDIVTYTFNDDDEAKVTIVAKAEEQTVKSSSKSKTVTGKDGKALVAAADCVFFAQTEDKVTVKANIIENADYEAYDIRELDTATWTDVLATIAKDKNDKVVAVFVNVTTVPDGASDTTVFGVISSYDGRVKDYYKYTVQVNGEEYTVNSESKLGDKGTLVKFNPTTNNNYRTDKVTVLKGTGDDKTDDYFEGYVKEFSVRDNTLTFSDKTVHEKDNDGKDLDSYKCDPDTTKTYALADDAKIIYVDQDNQKSTAESSVDAFNAINNKANVAFITKVVDNGVTVIDVLFVETSGKKNVNYRYGIHK